MRDGPEVRMWFFKRAPNGVSRPLGDAGWHCSNPTAMLKSVYL
jgi:hypothetical protein